MANTNPLVKFKVDQPVAKEIIIMGTSTISVGYTVSSVGKTVKIRDDHDGETSVNEYNPLDGRESVGYLPGCTSKILSLQEFVETVENNESEFEGTEEELLDILFKLELGD